MATAGAASLGLPERVVLDAIQQFLAGREWRANVQRFVDSRCESFVGLEEHKHEQYDIFNVRADSAHLGVAVQCSCARGCGTQEYHGFVDALLEATLADLGCSPAQLVAALERVSKTKGERDPLVALIDKVGMAWCTWCVACGALALTLFALRVHKLLAHGDFRSFSEMMTRRNAELQAHAMTQVASTPPGITSRDSKEADIATSANIPSAGSASSASGAGTAAGTGAMSMNVAESQEALLARAKRVRYHPCCFQHQD